MNTIGNTYYVSTDGDDTSAGDVVNPWRTITHAVDMAAAGDTVFVRGGTYAEPGRIIHQHSGEVGRPVLFSAVPGEWVTIDGKNVPVPDYAEDHLYGLWDFNGQEYITVAGFHLVDSQNAGFMANGSKHISLLRNTTLRSASSGIGIWNCEDVNVDGNEVALSCSNGYEESISIATSGPFEVSNNLVYNAPGFDKEGICLKDGAYNGRVYKNIVHQTGAVGIYIDAQGRYTHDIEVYQNEVYDAQANGLTLGSELCGLLENIWVYNNLIHHNRLIGIELSSHTASNAPAPIQHPMHHVRIINNTVAANGTYAENDRKGWGGGISLDPAELEDIVIRNNLISQNLSFQLLIGCHVPLNQLTYDHNLIEGYRNYGDNTCFEAHDIDRDDRCSAGGPHYRLTALSLDALDAGSSQEAPAVDFDGLRRPQGNGYDIGAFEYCPV